MGTAERRLELLKHLCRVRKTSMTQLAEKFGVYIRTIQRDIYEIEATFHAPIGVTQGQYDGGVSIVGDYTFDRIYMCDEELKLLTKIHSMVSYKLIDKEMFFQIIKKYSKPA